MFGLTPFVRGNRFFAAYDPFKEMEEIEDRFFGRQLPAFKTDIRETSEAFILEAELPGFKKEEIHAEIKDGILSINAERKTETDEKDEAGNYVRRERLYGSFSRRFSLEGIDTEKIAASYKNGILALTLPKLEPKKDEGRKLDIE